MTYFPGDSVSSLTPYFTSEFNNQRDQWETTLLKELKLTEIGNKATKKLPDGADWPTLSLESQLNTQLPSSSWKKASTTYSYLALDEISQVIEEDLAGGVRNFFFTPGVLNQEKWIVIEKSLLKYSAPEELEIFFLGERFESKNIKSISQIISGKKFHEQGGHSVHELGELSVNLVQNLKSLSGDTYLGVYVDSHFFHNIAKIRAARLLGMKILEEANIKSQIHIVALTSFEGWSLYERFSNMLRNETAVASAYIAGADYIQSSGYNSLIENETHDYQVDEHLERSRRMARNTTHVLALESMLGVVGDAAYGSYHLENLTQDLCQKSWIAMQKLLQGEDLTTEIQKVREQKLKNIKTRKTIFSGTNDYPDVQETLNLTLKEVSYFRAPRIFEELRLKMEKSSHRPEVYVALHGEYGPLNGRLNFVKNYFELLGLKVIEGSSSEVKNRKEEIIVMCALDDNYPEVEELVQKLSIKHKFIAGKYEMKGSTNLFVGQDVYEVLKNLVHDFTGGA